ncbi:MAG: cell division protein FtsZ [Candidatus Babeliales bacterium]
MIELDIINVEEEENQTPGVTLKLIGVGGGGGNAVNSMLSSADLQNVQFIVANTDAQALKASSAHHKIQLGAKITKGLGAGSNPEVGKKSAEEDLNNIISHFENTDILFLTAGLGGGTGSGALPVIASAAKELGVLTVAVVTTPFTFEGKRRAKQAEQAIQNLRAVVDTLIIVPNQRLLEMSDPKISMLNAFALANDVLKQAIKGISDIITKTGHINVDFADVKAIMKDMGMALMGSGTATGANRAEIAAQRAISSPLLENISIHGAKGVLINITGNENLGLQEINEAASLIYDIVSPEANIILGSVIDSSMDDTIMVTVIATGFENTVENQQAACAPLARPVAKAAVVEEVKPIPEPIKEEVVIEHHVAPVAPVAKPVEDLNFFTIEESKHAIAEPISFTQEQHTSGLMQESPVLDDSQEADDFDTPTYLRKKLEMDRQHNRHE